MKHLLVAVMVILLSPYLICDPQAGVEFYKLWIDGQGTGTMYLAQADGSARIDLEPFNLPDGSHEYVLSALNVYGESDPSVPFVSVKGVPASPSGLGLSK